jgi:coenzyme F420-0:L-glutamate ligase/coenzyme F420-1:gamma-L-glutamate ligase
VDLHVFAVRGIGEVTRGADVADLIAAAIERERRAVEPGDVFVVAQKIVSKAEGAVVRLDEVAPSPFASDWAGAHGKDPRIVEVVLRESRRIVRMDRDLLIAETSH